MVVRIDRYDRSYHLDLNLFRNPASRANFMVASAREKVQRQQALEPLIDRAAKAIASRREVAAPISRDARR